MLFGGSKAPTNAQFLVASCCLGRWLDQIVDYVLNERAFCFCRHDLTCYIKIQEIFGEYTTLVLLREGLELKYILTFFVH